MAYLVSTFRFIALNVKTGYMRSNKLVVNFVEHKESTINIQMPG